MLNPGQTSVMWNIISAVSNTNHKSNMKEKNVRRKTFSAHAGNLIAASLTLFFIALFSPLTFASFAKNTGGGAYSVAHPGQQAHTITVKGKVVIAASGEPLPGVTIMVENTRRGAVTDIDGNFSINASLGERLVFSYLGMNTQFIEVKNDKKLTVRLKEKADLLNEVTMVAFGKQSKESISTAISTIGSNEIVQSPVANISNSLAGRLAGLTTMQSSGQPGLDAATFYIRGQSSWGDNMPLYVIDGVERSASLFEAMDPNEIETISILKDAAATALYGSKGANGAIIITTKRGQAGRTNISFNSSYTLQKFTRHPNYLDSYQSLKLFNEALTNDGKDPVYSDEDLEHYRLQDDPYRYPNTDWYKLMMREAAPQYNASVNIRGGSRTVKYFVSGSYMKQEGQLKTKSTRMYNPEFSYKRYRISANVDAAITPDFSISGNVSANINRRHEPSQQLNVFLWMNRLPSWYMPVTNPDGSYAATSENKENNPAYLLNTRGSDERLSYYWTTSVDFDFNLRKLLKGLTLQLQGAYDTQQYSAKYWTEVQSTKQLVSRPGRADRYISYLKPEFYLPSTGGAWSSNMQKLYGLAQLEYENKFGDHSVKGQLIGNISTTTYGSAVPYNSVNFISRINYAYSNRYFVEFNVSHRGSENFAPGHRFGTFPSISAAWNIHKEKFMENVDFINFLKLRASYGLTGSDYSSTRFLYKQGKWTTSNSGGAPFGHNGGMGKGYTVEPSIADPNTTWEKSYQTNVGLDLYMFNQRFKFTVDRFYEKRKDILQTPNSIPSIIGIGLPVMNIGKTSKEGWEFEASYGDRILRDVSWWVSGNFSFVKNKIDFIDEPEGLDWWRKEEGRPIFQQFGYVVTGYFRDREDIQNSPKQQVGTAPIPGDFKYLDFNGDNIINEKDRVPIGYPQVPRVYYGFSLGSSYKGLSLNLHFQGAAQSSIFIQNYLMYEFYNRGKVQDIHLGRWTPQTAETATYPALHVGGESQNHVKNTYFLKDNSYLRLKTAELSYLLQGERLAKIGVSGMRFYISGYNLITWDNLKVVDPESPNDPDAGLYPQSRNYSVGINIIF